MASVNGVAQKRGARIRVRPTDLHGGQFGPDGGIFLSSQLWNNAVAPHCVAADYTGAVMGPDHFSKVVCGDPILTTTYTAASVDAPC